MSAASIVLITGQLGFTMLELAQTYKKNRDFIVMKNLVVLLTVMLTWFCFGYAIAFGTNNKALDIQFGGFYHGWFGDLTGGLRVDPNLDPTKQVQVTEVPITITQEDYVPQEVADLGMAFNQRRFFVFFCFMVIASNIATSSISERCNMMPMVYFVVL
jgi:ammonia channel protein AmtB